MGRLLLFAITMLVFGVFIFMFYKQSDSNKIYNLFYEINYSDFYSGYRGKIKTLKPNGKEKTIWKSDTYVNRRKCEEDTKLRYNFLCNFYGQKT